MLQRDAEKKNQIEVNNFSGRRILNSRDKYVKEFSPEQRYIYSFNAEDYIKYSFNEVLPRGNARKCAGVELILRK